RVVEIARRLPVNRDDGQVAKVATAGALGVAHGMRHRGGFNQRFRWKLVRKVVLADQDLDVNAEIARPPENLDHTASRRNTATREAGQLHVDDGAVEFRQTLPTPALSCGEIFTWRISRGFGWMRAGFRAQ